MLLPTYDVFDEGALLRAGREAVASGARRRDLALTICEDAWNDKQFWARRLYSRDPVEELAAAGRAASSSASTPRPITWASAS